MLWTSDKWYSNFFYNRETLYPDNGSFNEQSCEMLKGVYPTVKKWWIKLLDSVPDYWVTERERERSGEVFNKMLTFNCTLHVRN